MNLPNKLTIFRIILVPIIMLLYAFEPLRNQAVLYPALSMSNFSILILFIIGSVTDFLDGNIARRRGLVTDFGKSLDPVADKLLVFTALLILMDQSAYYREISGETYVLIEWWMIIILLTREFLVTALRMVAASKGKVLAAVWHGKIKTVLQMATIIVMFAGCAVVRVNGEYNLLSNRMGYVVFVQILIYLMLVVTIFSGADYLIKNKDVLFDTKPYKKKR
jgi:CDP-diacylglycerol--glycerol-3-phosphate 3-phosphatidyltransferase